jgi:hypothetical protein
MSIKDATVILSSFSNSTSATASSFELVVEVASVSLSRLSNLFCKR